MTLLEWRRVCRERGTTVVGLGVSNLPLIEFLLRQGIPVTARDQKTRAELDRTAQELEQRGVRLILGEHYLDEIDEGVIFRAPGMRPDHPAFCRAIERGAILSSEIELFLELTPANVLGITGSDGKTTTTTLTGLMLEAACKRRAEGRVFVGGNIGTPPIGHVDEMRTSDYCVLELSSFQLQTLRRSLPRAAVTNVTPNHLNWHTDMAEYVAAKANIYAHSENRLLVVNAENAITCAAGKAHAGAVTWFSSRRASVQDFADLMRVGDRAVFLADGGIVLYDGKETRPILQASQILLPGKHNLENYMTAIALTEGLVDAEDVRQVATSFRGVPHRLEWIRTVDGVKYYNSSIDSSPTRTAAALSALPGKPIVICGGYDKKIPFEPLAEALVAHARAVVLTGATADKIRAALDAREDVNLPIYRESGFADAVHRARAIAQEGDTVLLSPACASFDAFQNFEERGNTFRRIVEGFSGKPETEK